jgi:hypothetical protein
MAEIQTSTWSETAASNNAAPPDGCPEGQSYASLNNCIREIMAVIKRWWNREHATVVATGTADAMVLTYTTSPGSLTSGMFFRFYSPNSANTVTNPTLNVNGIGAKTIFKRDGLTALAAGDIVALTLYEVTYDGTAFRIHQTGK